MKLFAKAIALVLLVAVAAPVAAQSLTGTVSGTVKDEQGGALPGVVVTLTGRTGSQDRDHGDAGDYRFVGLDPGAYSVQTADERASPDSARTTSW